MARIIDSIEHERGRLADDPHRPRYHFLPPSGWMNDPNGFIHHRGVYHLFYQYNPAGGYHADIQWGHARSADLVHWEDRPIALTPTPDGRNGLPSVDVGGCWSGSAVDANGIPLIFYSSVYPQTVSLATGSDNLDTWMKHPANPLIAGPPEGFGGDSLDFRDPYVWREGEWWYMVMGSRVQGGGGAVLLYRSADLLDWAYRGPLMLGGDSGEPFHTGTVWECPNLFSLDGHGRRGRHVLLISFQDHLDSDLLYVGYYVGEFTDEQFEPESLGILEYGDALYAPQVTTDARGRRVLFGWLREKRDAAAQRAAGWSGVMSLPRILSLGPDGALRQQPAPELEQLRGTHFHVNEQIIQPGDNPLAGVRGDCLEIDAVLEPDDATAFGLRLRRSPDGEEEAILRCDVVAGHIAFDLTRAGREQASETGSLGRKPVSGAAERAPLPAERPLRLRVFLDRSAIEVFVNDSVVLSTRVYPTRPDSLEVALFAEGGALRVGALDVWEMGSIWPID